MNMKTDKSDSSFRATEERAAVGNVNSHDAFLKMKKILFDPFGLEPKNILIEKESTEYGACRFELDGLRITFRVAKITPTKTGQFVTLWKRKKEGPIEPYHIKDDVDRYIIFVNFQSRSGQFIFPKTILHEKGILSGKKEGKRGFRVYPPWDLSLNKQAQKTQSWQSDYFMENLSDPIRDKINVRKLLS